MQVRAIIEAALEVAKKTASEAPIVPEIMHPLVATMGPRDSKYLRRGPDRQDTAKAVVRGSAATRSEVPGRHHDRTAARRACGPARSGRASAEFFSFGTNDLTQTTFGISRDDAASFLGAYLSANILPGDPFVSIDQDGVGALVEMAAERGRATRKDLKLGICGEHGGDPASVAFCDKVGLNYVSCSPFRVPIARLAAAQATIKAKGAKASTTA